MDGSGSRRNLDGKTAPNDYGESRIQMRHSSTGVSNQSMCGLNLYQ